MLCFFLYSLGFKIGHANRGFAGWLLTGHNCPHTNKLIYETVSMEDRDSNEANLNNKIAIYGVKRKMSNKFIDRIY